MLFWFLIIAGIIAAAGACCCVTCPLNKCEDYCEAGTEQPEEITLTITGVGAPNEDGASCYSCWVECDCDTLDGTYVLTREDYEAYGTDCKRYTHSLSTICNGGTENTYWSIGIQLIDNCPTSSDLDLWFIANPGRYFDVPLPAYTVKTTCGQIGYKINRGPAKIDCGTEMITGVLELDQQYINRWINAHTGSNYSCPFFCDFTDATITIEV